MFIVFYWCDVPAYVVDLVTWCSNVPGSPERDDNTCSYDPTCARMPEASFWLITSIQVGQNSCPTEIRHHNSF